MLIGHGLVCKISCKRKKHAVLHRKIGGKSAADRIKGVRNFKDIEIVVPKKIKEENSESSPLPSSPSKFSQSQSASKQDD